MLARGLTDPLDPGPAKGGRLRERLIETAMSRLRSHNGGSVRGLHTDMSQHAERHRSGRPTVLLADAQGRRDCQAVGACHRSRPGSSWEPGGAIVSRRWAAALLGAADRTSLNSRSGTVAKPETGAYPRRPRWPSGLCDGQSQLDAYASTMTFLSFWQVGHIRGRRGGSSECPCSRSGISCPQSSFQSGASPQ